MHEEHSHADEHEPHSTGLTFRRSGGVSRALCSGAPGTGVTMFFFRGRRGPSRLRVSSSLRFASCRSAIL